VIKAVDIEEILEKMLDQYIKGDFSNITDNDAMAYVLSELLLIGSKCYCCMQSLSDQLVEQCKIKKEIHNNVMVIDMTDSY
jgi:hypothetical protein